jgi:hypothetical protein
MLRPMQTARARRQRLTRDEARKLYREALAAGFPITHCPPIAWQLDPHPAPVKRELAMLIDELIELIKGLPFHASGKGTVARAYKRAVRISLAQFTTPP